MTDYPRWVCLDCGYKYGRRIADGHVCTMHLGVCGVCGKHTHVAEPRDFGHLKDGWQGQKA